MVLSPKARRFVADAIADFGDGRARALWGSFQRDPGSELSPEIARIALRALEFVQRGMAQRIESGSLDEDEVADLTNDLQFIRSLETDLRRSCSPAAGSPRHPVA
jgi:hypothetical protein